MNLEKRVERLENLIINHMPALVKQERIELVLKIQKAIADHYYLPLPRMLSKQRIDGIVWPRQLSMALAYEVSHLSTTELAPLFNVKDHGTILHACHRVRAEESMRNGRFGDVKQCRDLVNKLL